ncbi:hypothetical protein HY604_03710 [Candidatus Peregrinibacteria bacterium]|nr:hypothetical protein [Candidatus Peregrinibacteria bacterium]
MNEQGQKEVAGVDKRASMRIAAAGLIGLIIGLVVGIYVPAGGVTGQGKLVLKSDSKRVDEKCQAYKMLISSGVLSSALDMRGIEDEIQNCEETYPDFWQAEPTFKECQKLKVKYDSGVLTDYMKSRKLSDLNLTYCTNGYPWLWFQYPPSQNECNLYMEFNFDGSLASKIGRENVAYIQEQCAASGRYEEDAVSR